MRERTKLSSHLYVRVDSPLRDALADAAEAQGVTVSDFARRELRAALDAPAPSPVGRETYRLLLDVMEGTRTAPPEQLVEWREALTKGRDNLQAVQDRTLRLYEADAVKLGAPAVFEAWRRVSPRMIERLNGLIADLDLALGGQELGSDHV